MHCRKLHSKSADAEKLNAALKELYAEGVRIPFGKPYEMRKRAAEAVAIADESPADETDALELLPDNALDAPATGNPYESA